MAGPRERRVGEAAERGCSGGSCSRSWSRLPPQTQPSPCRGTLLLNRTQRRWGARLASRDRDAPREHGQRFPGSRWPESQAGAGQGSSLPRGPEQRKAREDRAGRRGQEPTVAPWCPQVTAFSRHPVSNVHRMLRLPSHRHCGPPHPGLQPSLDLWLLTASLSRRWTCFLLHLPGREGRGRGRRRARPGRAPPLSSGVWTLSNSLLFWKLPFSMSNRANHACLSGQVGVTGGVGGAVPA